MTDQEEFFRGERGNEGMLVTRLDDSDELYFGYWRCGSALNKPSLWTRLKMCYRALFKGNYYNDEIALHEKETLRLANWINDAVKINKMRRTREELQSAVRIREDCPESEYGDQ